MAIVGRLGVIGQVRRAGARRAHEHQEREEEDTERPYTSFHEE